MQIFVYGTLRRGEPGHSLLRSARFVGEAVTCARYELVDLGEYPALIEGGTTAVVGEIYDVDAALLAELDVFEDVPELYERKRVRVASARVASARVEGYVMRADDARGKPRIPSGDWRVRETR